MPVISVVMPVYNVPERYLRESIEAMLRQTFADFELLIVNDASTAEYVAPVLAEYAAADSRVKVFTLPENRGVSAARNQALDCAEGEYLGFVDGDDVPAADYFATLYAAARREDADLVLSGFRRFSDAGRTLKVRRPHQRIAGDGGDRERSAMFRELSYALWNKLFLRRTHGHLRFHTDLALGEDIVYVAEAFLNSRRAVSLRYAGYAYRYNAQSATSTAGSGVESIRNTMIILPCLGELLKRCVPPEPLAREFRRYVLWLFIRYAHKFHRIQAPDLKLSLWNEYRALYAPVVAMLGNGSTGFVRLTAALLARRRTPASTTVVWMLRWLLRTARV